MAKLNDFVPRLAKWVRGWQNQRRIAGLARRVAAEAPGAPGSYAERGNQEGRGNQDQPPVVFFNASTRLTGLSQNAAFSLLAGWGLRLAGVPVVHFVCHSGMSRCVLGTNREDFAKPPPCRPCIAQSRRMYAGAQVRWFEYRPAADLAAALQNLSVDQLSSFEIPLAPDNPGSHAERGIQGRAAGFSSPLPLGHLVMPAIRWALRRHHLPDDEPTRFLLREYMLSAYSVACEFSALLDEVRPAAAVIFNGIMYPEAAARWVARQRGLRVITHEVGFQRFSTFFTGGDATAYPIHIPQEFELSPEQNKVLDDYLEKRFQGQFTMAGIRFWPEMRGLDESFLQRAAGFRQIVPVFTNVVYDTSQVHANVVFPHMFAWLDLVLELIRQHPETLFVIRAHPDEMRPGTAKQSRESVRNWVLANGVNDLPNVVFIDSQEYISSYELIQRARFILVYNSSIGLEAALMGRAVLCGGQARYTQYPIVYFPGDPQAYRRQAEEFLARDVQPTPAVNPATGISAATGISTATGISAAAGVSAAAGPGSPRPIPIPAEFQRNARRFLYYQLFRASLPLEDYLQAGPRQGFVEFKPFSWRKLLPENSLTLQILVNGILGRDGPGEQPFYLPE